MDGDSVKYGLTLLVEMERCQLIRLVVVASLISVRKKRERNVRASRGEGNGDGLGCT